MLVPSANPAHASIVKLNEILTELINDLPDPEALKYIQLRFLKFCQDAKPFEVAQDLIRISSYLLNRLLEAKTPDEQRQIGGLLTLVASIQLLFMDVDKVCPFA